MRNHCACKEDLIPCPPGPHFWLLPCTAWVLPALFLNWIERLFKKGTLVGETVIRFEPVCGGAGVVQS